MGIVIPDSVGGTAQESNPSNRLVIPQSVGGTDPDPVQQDDGEMGTWESTKSIFTGKGRTEFEDMPEFDLPLGAIGPSEIGRRRTPKEAAVASLEGSWKQFKTALGLMTTFDKQKQLNILKENYPKLEGAISADKYGNVIIDGSAYGGNVGYMNVPGISARDMMQAGFQVAAFTPAGKAAGMAAKAGYGLPTRSAAAAVAAMGVQAGQDITGQAVGTTEDVSPKNIDIQDVALAGAGGFVGELVSPILAKAWKPLKNAFRNVWERSKVLSEEAKTAFRQAAVNAGEDPASVTDELITSFMDAADEAVDPENIAAIQQSREFGLPYTKGQAMPEGAKKIEQLSLEDTLRHSKTSPGATRKMQAFEQDVQQPAMVSAKERVKRELAEGQDLSTSPTESAARVGESVQTAEQQAWDVVGDAYKAVGDAEVIPEGIRGIVDAVKRTAREGRFITDKQLAPATKLLLKEATQLQTILKKVKGVKPFHINEVENFRKKILAFEKSAANPNDKRQIQLLKRQFDDAYDDVVEQGLITGDLEALDAMKNARSLRRRFATMFQEDKVRVRSGRQVPDPAGRMIEEIAAGVRTPEQIANMLFGVSKLGGNTASYQFAKRLQNIFPQGTPEWNAIRQGAFLFLTKPNTQGNISGRIFRNKLQDATKGKGGSYMNLLFNPAEIAKFRRLASAIIRAQPEIDNPSKTAYKAASMVQQQFKQVAATLGFQVGGVPGAVAGRVGAEAVTDLASFRQSMKVTKILKGPLSKGTQVQSTQVAAPLAVSSDAE